MTRQPEVFKLHFIRTIYAEIMASTESTRKKSPQFYVSYLNNATAEVIKSFCKSRGAIAASGAIKLTRSLSQRIAGTGTSTAPIGTSFSDIKDIVEQVKFNIQSSVESTWLVSFIELGGLSALFSLLDTIHKKPEKKHKHYEVEAEVLKVMKIIANHEVCFLFSPTT
jgi:hypothetical protein